MNLLGIDIGTSTTKVVLYGVDGGILASTSSEYDVHFPKPHYAEHDTDDWRKALRKSLRFVLKRSGVSPEDISAIGVSGHAPSVLPVDRKGKPLGYSITWMDRRAQKETQAINDRVGAEYIYKLSGNRLDPLFVFPKMMWFKENRPRIYNRTFKFLSSKDYIVSQLTGEYTTDRTIATAYFCLDVTSAKKTEEVYEAFDMDIEKVPEIHEGTKVVGDTNAQATSLGLPRGIPVVAGGLDAIVAGVGLGATKPGDAGLIVGTSSSIQVSTRKPVLDPQRRFISNFHSVKNRWIITSIQNTTGALLRWFRDKIWSPIADKKDTKGNDVYTLMTKLASKSPPGARGLILLPYFAGERTPIWDAHAKGVFFGLALKHTLPDILRSVLESSALGLLHNSNILSDIGVVIRRILIAGGPARSSLWNQIRSDALGKRIMKPAVRHPENRGSAILAGLGTKLLTDHDLNQWVKIEETYTPNRKNTKLYSKLVEIYIKLYNQTQDLTPDLEEVA